MASRQLLTVYQNLFTGGDVQKVKEFKEKASHAATDPQPFVELLKHLSGDPTWSPSAYEQEAFGYIMNRDANAELVKPWDDAAHIGEGW